MLTTDFLFTEKYRPQTVADTILPATLKKQFSQYVDQGNVPNLLLSGPPGTGKTTVAMAMLEELNCEHILINGSLSGNIDTLRNEIRQFASTMPLFKKGRKYVILDEADYLNPNSTQPALRNFMEEYSINCGFILTCNYKSKVIEPLQSRCSLIEFKIPAKEKPVLASQFLKRACAILKMERIEYDEKAVAGLITKLFPDWRRMLNELQAYSATGKIDTGMLVNFTDTTVKKLIKLMKDKNFTEARKWVAEHADIEPVDLFEKIYRLASEHVQPKSIPVLVEILAKYSYQSAFVAHQEINTAACIAELSGECQFL